ncbi:MAG: DUF362 domain-containing protein [Deltaproteobacteria bacterium]|nr:DUF362 domain-containing protein [Deltaproteobacteria bacterium]
MTPVRLDRRRFLLRLARLGFVMAGPATGALPLFRVPEAAAAPTPRPLADAKGKDPAALVRQAVGKLGGMARFVRPGQTVVVKPNLGWDRRPEEGANTHPAVLAEVCRLALEAGARTVRVFDRTCNDARRTYERSGARAAVEGLGTDRVRLEYVDEDRFEVVALQNATKLTRWPLYRPALEADVLINVPVVKHHGLTGLTASMKNLMGVMGGNRGRIHQGVEDNLVDANFAVRSHLVVVDATRILLRNGPQGGGTEGVRIADRLAATTDVVAADAWAAREFGVDPLSIATIRRGAERGLGVADLSRVPIL